MRNETDSDGQQPKVVPVSPDNVPLPLIETDLLIVGAGPAGASLACFLASHGRSQKQVSGYSDVQKASRQII
jgi:NADPH-dependent 2,4-dienoyl-CoA reductase/sulfur reductase-like enzyme